MAQSYRIETLGGPTLWEDGGTKGDYFSTLSGFDGEVLIFHDSSSDFDPPKIGDEVFGDVEKDKRGNFRLKRKPKIRGGGGGKGGGGYSPADIARMSRSHAQEMALRFVASTGDTKDMNLEDPKVVGAYLNGPLKRITDWFTKDVEAAEAAMVVKAAPAPVASNGGGAEVPADTRELQPAAAPGTSDGDDIPF